MQFNKTKINYAITSVLALCALTLPGCGGSSGGTSGPVLPPQTDTGNTNTDTSTDTSNQTQGVFRTGSAPVQGLSFETGGQTGTTDIDGHFYYNSNDAVTFSIGGITLGTIDAAEVVTPVSLFADADTLSLPVQNMNRLLQLLDSDNDSENGISIYPEILEQAHNYAQVEFDSEYFEQDVAAIVSDVASVDEQSAGLPPLFTPTEYTQVATVATLNRPWGDGIAMTPEGDVILSGGYDKDDIIKVTPEGEVSTLVSGLPGPVGIDYDSQGNLYVANYTGNSISKIAPDGTISTFASELDGPAGLLVTPDDKILVSLYGANFSGVGATILQFDLAGNQSVYAQGNGLSDVIGLAQDEKGRVFATNWQTGALFKIVNGVAVQIATTGDPVNQITYANGYVYLPALNDNKIYRAAVYSGSEEGEIETFAGSGQRESIDGDLSDSAFYRLFNAVASEDGKQIYVLGQDGKLRLISAPADGDK